MKRKIAILLASVMTLSMLPMNLFAASNNHFTKTPTTIPADTLLYEEARDFYGLTSGGTDVITGYRTSKQAMTETSWWGTKLLEVSDDFDDESAVGYAVQGSNFVITPSDVIREGDTFKVKLDNAKWFFRSTNKAAQPTNKALTAPLKKLNTSGAAFGLTEHVIPTDLKAVHDYFKDKEPNITEVNALSMTYFADNGIYVPDGEDKESGTYYRTKQTADPSISGQDGQIPYTLRVSPLDPSQAIITIVGKGPTKNDPKDEELTVYDQTSTTRSLDIVLPLVTLATEKADIKVSIQSSLTGISTGTYIYGISGGGATNTKFVEYETSRDEFHNDRIVIEETRLSSIGQNGSIMLKAPKGFSWAGVKDAVVKAEPGIKWGHSEARTGEGIRFDNDALKWEDDNDNTFIGKDEVSKGYDEDKVIHYLHYGTLTSGEPEDGEEDWAMSERLADQEHVVADSSQAGGYKDAADFDYALGYNFVEESSASHESTIHRNDDRHYDTDESEVILVVADLQSSAKVSGSLYIEGLYLVADDDAGWGPIKVAVTNVKNDDGLGITNQTAVVAGDRVDFGVNLKALTDAPTLISGRYEDYKSAYYDDFQQAAKVRLYEATQNSWWSGRTTTLTLPEKVRFSQVDITMADDMVEEDALKESGIAGYDDNYRNDGKKVHNVTVDDNKLTFNNLKVEKDEKGAIEMDLWLSIAADFEGDVVLKAEGSAIPAGQEPSVVIAKAIAPVKIETKNSDIKIGYQYQKTADIKITETKAGNLVRGKKVNISVTDLVSVDVQFSPSTTVEVTDGDLKIKNKSTIGAGSYLTGLGGTSNAISFDVDKASTKASTITLTNVSVKVDRSVPVSNDRPYDVVVWGGAIAQNFNTTATARKDEFDVPGVKAPYIRVVSAANDKPDVLSSEVRVTIGERTYAVNGEVFEMDAAAYVSPKSNSTMVPLRFVAYAFGLGTDQVIWDGTNRTVTLIHPTRVVQFAIGSQMMLVNGAAVTMTSPDGLPVSAEITGERAYVPFRALGEAFGVPVSWKADTNTAVYNEGASASLGLAAPVTTPATTTPATDASGAAVE